jgi:hypothetical protein
MRYPLYTSLTILLIIFFSWKSAYTATFVVTNTNDSGVGSLRAGITTLSGDGNRDTITFDPSVMGTITLTTGGFNIDDFFGDYLVIVGPGADKLSIDGNNTAIIFSIKSVDIYNLKITGGMLAVSVNGSSNATLNRVVISGNSNTGTPAGVQMNSSGTLNIFNSVISGNINTSNGAGFKMAGGIVNIVNTTITGNQTDFGGGGVRVEGGTLNLKNSIVAKNVSANGCCPQHDIQVTGGTFTPTTNLIGDVNGSGLVASLPLLGSSGMEADPMFEMNVTTPPPTMSGDLRLKTSSPALNMGVNGDIPHAPFDAYDLAGSPRVKGTVNLGAFEEPTPPTFSMMFNPTSVETNMPSVLTFTINNTASLLAATNLSFTHILPLGVQIAAVPNGMTTCSGGSIIAAAGTNTIMYSGGGSVQGAGTCTVSVNVIATSAGIFPTTSDNLTSSAGDSGNASATLTAVIPVAVPTLSQWTLITLLLMMLIVGITAIKNKTTSRA